jgi:hypothetical protein
MSKIEEVHESPVKVVYLNDISPVPMILNISNSLLLFGFGPVLNCVNVLEYTLQLIDPSRGFNSMTGWMTSMYLYVIVLVS